MDTYYAFVRTAWGPAALVCSGRGLRGFCLPERGERRLFSWLRKNWPDSRHDASLALPLQEALRAYFDGDATTFDWPVDLESVSEFHRHVLQACRKVAYGRTTTYGGLARTVGRPRAARAVGSAMARNPVPLVIPCHRVVAADGSLCGFSASQGVAMKRRLLEWEASHRASIRKQG